MKDNIVGQGGKGEDNWTIGFRQHEHQGVTPWVASHAFLVIIINIIVLVIISIIIIIIIVITWMASLIMFPKEAHSHSLVASLLGSCG